MLGVVNAMGKRKSPERVWEWWERGKIAIFNGVVRNSFTESLTLANDPKEVRNVAVWISGGRGLQEEEQPALRSKAEIKIQGCGRNIKKGDLAGAE